MEKMRNIIEKLNAASEAYYSGKDEIMTNAEWDSLFDELVKMESDTGIIYPDSPTHKVSENNIGNKIEHEYPALSLAKTKSVDELIRWANGKDVWMSWKLDGLTLVATYKSNGEKSVLKSLATRGNGHTGTDVTYLAPYIKTVPDILDYPYDITVRGEAVISYEDFEEVNKDEEFANPRNMVAGSMSLQDIDEFEKRRIHFVAFTLVYTEEKIQSWGSRMDLLERLGFEVVERKKCSPDTIKDVNLEFTEKTNSVKYPVDGLVIVYDDTVYASGGSVTGHHATRAGFAFKWADEEVISSLKYIDWSCSASSINPVAVFEPVDILGTCVRRASLHNVSECRRLGIGGKGTTISVIKANMIIPQVVRVNERVGEFVIPERCPVCGAETKIRKSESGTETLVCTSENCPAKNVSKFSRFVSKDALNIDGMSEATIRTFISAGLINDFIDIFRLPEHIKEMSELDGFGERSIKNLVKAIEKSRTVDADKLLYGMCIPLCGRDVSKRILTAYSFEEFKTKLKETNDPLFLAGIEGIGPEKSKAIYEWGRSHSFEAFEKILTVKDIKSQDGKCSGYTFVITGKVNHYKNRDELRAYIEGQGGKVAESISSKTSYLINNDSESTSGKNKKAKQLGIDIITENEFIERFGARN